MNNIISEIKVSNNIVLLCHNNPDGDAVGSTIAMYILLKRLGKEVDIVLDTLDVYKRQIIRSFYFKQHK